MKQPFYHGTNSNFDQFNKIDNNGKISTIFGNKKIHREGFFFTDAINIAKYFGNIIFEVYLNTNKTLDLRQGFSPSMINEFKNSLNERWMENIQPMTAWDIFDGDEGIYFVNVLRKHNYDSVIINECNQAGKVFSSYIVFDPENIHVNKKITPAILRKTKP